MTWKLSDRGCDLEFWITKHPKKELFLAKEGSWAWVLVFVKPWTCMLN